MTKNADVHIVFITGLSGAGKSSAHDAFEDQGYFTIDNLPPEFAFDIVDKLCKGKENICHYCFGIDVRERSLIECFPEVVQKFRAANMKVDIIFLEASEEVLVRRYSATKRIHPMSPRGSIIKGILKERKQLSKLRKEANLVIDTSEYTIYSLRERLRDLFYPEKSNKHFMVTLISFGFKNGIPTDADLVFDVRFLPNPYYVPHLQSLTGVDNDVREYVLSHDEAEEFLERAAGMLLFLLPLYKKEGKRYVTIAVGCTGGQHRSVALLRELKSRLSPLYPGIEIRDRDREK